MSSSSPDQRKNPRSSASTSTVDERINLNVGGCIFETLQSTLVENSSYFAAKFSDEWKDSQNQLEKEIFMDHDPDLFRVLLSYMRYGRIDAKDLTKDVLVLAEYLGIDRLVRAAKLLLARHWGLQDDDDDKLLNNLDRCKGPLQDWSAQGIQDTLTSTRHSGQQALEFASIYVHKPDSRFPGKFVAPPYRAGLRTMFHRHNSSSSLNGHNHSSEGESQHHRPPRPEFDELSDKGGFFLPVFALNWLGKHVFQVAPPSLQTFRDKKHCPKFEPVSINNEPRPSDVGTFLDELLFVRTKQQVNSSNNNNNNNAAAAMHRPNNDTIIITGGPLATTADTLEPKEYATLNAVLRMENRVFVQCAGGEPVFIPRLDNTRLRRTGRLHCFNMVLALEWLRNHGFVTQEPQLEEFLSRAQDQTDDTFYGPTMVFSRHLVETTKLIPVRELEPVKFKDKVRRDGFEWVSIFQLGLDI